MAVEHITDVREQGIDRLLHQFKDASSLHELLGAILDQNQELEDSAAVMMTLLDPDTQEGAQLDLIGRRIGQPRWGLGDVDYRLWLKARMAVNASDGTTPELVEVLKLILGDGISVDSVRVPPAAFELQVRDVLNGTDGRQIADLLIDGFAAGDRGVLMTHDASSEALALRFDDNDPTTAVPGFMHHVQPLMWSALDGTDEPVRDPIRWGQVMVKAEFDNVPSVEWDEHEDVTYVDMTGGGADGAQIENGHPVFKHGFRLFVRFHSAAISTSTVRWLVGVQDTDHGYRVEKDVSDDMRVQVYVGGAVHLETDPVVTSEDDVVTLQFEPHLGRIVVSGASSGDGTYEGDPWEMPIAETWLGESL